MSDNKEITTAGTWDSFLTDKPEEDASYVVPNIETKLSKEKRNECREIVREILDFGISQRQLLYLISLLSLELEDIITMKALNAAIGENRERTAVDALEKPKGSGLILPGQDD